MTELRKKFAKYEKLTRDRLVNDLKFRERRFRAFGIIDEIVKRWPNTFSSVIRSAREQQIDPGKILKEAFTMYGSINRLVNKIQRKEESLRGNDYKDKWVHEDQARKELGYHNKLP